MFERNLLHWLDHLLDKRYLVVHEMILGVELTADGKLSCLSVVDGRLS